MKTTVRHKTERLQLGHDIIDTIGAAATTGAVAFFFGEVIHRIQTLLLKMPSLLDADRWRNLADTAGPTLFHMTIILTGFLRGINPLKALPTKNRLIWLIISGPGWLAVVTAGAIATRFLLTTDNAAQTRLVTTTPPIDWWLASVLIAPVLEETVYRGLLSPWFRKYFGPLRGTWFAAVAFAWIHTMPTFAGAMNGNFGAVLPGPFFLALICDWIYQRTGSLWPAILFHAGCNATPIILNAIDPRWLKWLEVLYQW